METEMRASSTVNYMAIFKSLMLSLKTAVITYLKTQFVNIIATTLSVSAMCAVTFILEDVILLNCVGDVTIGNQKFGNITLASAWMVGMIMAAAADVIARGKLKRPHSTAIHHIVQKNYYLAQPARDVLISSGVNICSNYSTLQLVAAEPFEPNLTKIKAITHSAIHSQMCNTIYTEWVNIIITNTPHKNNYGLLNYLSVATSLTLIEGTIKAADNML
jgi:hypothetical protein